ncbi:thioredoxin family protein [Kangiella sp. M94]
MSKFIRLGIALIASQLMLTACQTGSNHQQQTNLLVGDTSYPELIRAYPYFQTAKSTVKEAPKAVEKLKAVSEATQLTVYFGVWCHDSIREVPQLVKLLEEVNNPNISYQLISLDKTKQEPLGRARANDILYTPTIVVSQAGKELGRIIEKPEQDLATDLVNILH